MRFADTFFYLALLNPRDAAHADALTLSRAVRGGVLTTAFVLTELADGLARPPARRTYLELLAALTADPQTHIVPVSEALFDRGSRLYAERPDQSWSLTDCVSFVVMEEHGVTEALTGDHHFEQAGFIALLKPQRRS